MNNVFFVSSVMLLIAAFGAIVQGNDDANTDSGVIQELHLIGTADGVSYFYENTTPRSWFDAGKYCQSTGMQLATINTEKQFEMLKSFRLPGIEFWTAGTDADEIWQFKWNHTHGAVPSLLKDGYLSHYIPVYRTCLQVISDDNYLKFYSSACSSAALTLCST